MNVTKIAILVATITVSFNIAQAAEVPDALTVEWEVHTHARSCLRTHRCASHAVLSRRNSARLPLTPGLP